MEVLNEAGWRIGGKQGAAARLGLPRTTLLSRMRKLGIETRKPKRQSEISPVPPEATQFTPTWTPPILTTVRAPAE